MLLYLDYLLEWLHTFTSTFDIDPIPRGIVVESMDCIGPSVADGLTIDVGYDGITFARFHVLET